jgi:hypothetical protein
VGLDESSHHLLPEEKTRFRLAIVENTYSSIMHMHMILMYNTTSIMDGIMW